MTSMHRGMAVAGTETPASPFSQVPAGPAPWPEVRRPAPRATLPESRALRAEPGSAWRRIAAPGKTRPRACESTHAEASLN